MQSEDLWSVDEGELVYGFLEVVCGLALRDAVSLVETEPLGEHVITEPHLPNRQESHVTIVVTMDTRTLANVLRSLLS